MHRHAKTSKARSLISMHNARKPFWFRCASIISIRQRSGEQRGFLSPSFPLLLSPRLRTSFSLTRLLWISKRSVAKLDARETTGLAWIKLLYGWSGASVLRSRERVEYASGFPADGWRESLIVPLMAINSLRWLERTVEGVFRGFSLFWDFF